MQFHAALMGVNFRGKEIANLVASLDVGTEFTFEREPDNQYDANAIKVLYANDANDDNAPTFVGFVAKEVAEELAPLMDSGYELSGKITEFLGTIKPMMEIEACIPSGMDEESEADDADDEDESDEDASASAA